jgi:hypothetical protein
MGSGSRTASSLKRQLTTEVTEKKKNIEQEETEGTEKQK